MPPQLLQWAFAPSTDRQEAKAVMEFVVRLLEEPDVGDPVTGPPGGEDTPDVRHAHVPGTTTRVVWRFYRPLHWVEILAPGTAETTQA